MKIRIVLLLLAIIFGVAAVIGVMIYLNNVRSSIEEEGETVSVIVVSEYIAAETKVSDMVSAKLIETKQIPKKFVVENALATLDGYEDYVAKIAITKGEQLTAGKLGKIEEIRISFTVPENFIAVSIPYNEIKGVSNLIKVGDKVNIIGTFQPEGELVLFNKDMVTQMLLQMKEDESGSETVTEGGVPSSDFLTMDNILDESNYLLYPVTKILLWNIEVLYIGTMTPSSGQQEDEKSGVTSSSSKNQEETKTVTLALTPEQAEMLVFTEELCSVWLALVPAGGIDEVETPGRTYLNIID